MARLCGILTVSYKDKLFLVKISLSCCIMTFSSSIIILALLCALIRECLSPNADDLGPEHHWLASMTLSFLWIAIAPLAVLPYIHSGTSEDVGELLHLPCSCCCGRFECSKVVVFMLGSILIFSSFFLFLFNFLCIGLAYNTYPDATRDAFNTIATIILGIGLFLFAELIFDKFYGFGNVITMKVSDRLYRKNMIRVSNEKQAVYDILFDVFKRNKGSFFSFQMIKSVLERDDRLEKKVGNKTIMYCLKAIPGISYRMHQRTKQRIYGLKSIKRERKWKNKKKKKKKKKLLVIKDAKDLEKMRRLEEEERKEQEIEIIEEKKRKISLRGSRMTKVVPFTLSSSNHKKDEGESQKN